MTQSTVPRRVKTHLFEIAVAAVWAIVGFAYLTDPDLLVRSTVGRQVGPLAMVWSAFYLLGGPLAIYGLLHPAPHFRIAGLTLLAAGLLMHGVAAVTYELEPRVSIYFIYAATCGLRAVHVIRTEIHARSSP